jgi:hypothetical protein
MKDPLKTYRRRFRSWKNRVRLKGELEGYEAAFASQGLAIPDDSAIRLALQNRFPGSGPKPKGALSIIAVYHNYNWEDGALKPALEKFGTVRRYDWFKAFDHSGRDWRSSVKAEMNRDLAVRIGQWVAEGTPRRNLHLPLRGTHFSRDRPGPPFLRVPMIHFSLNDKEHFVGKVRGGLAFGSRDICRWFDLCWTSTEDALKKYCVEGALPVYIPEGANPEFHRPWEQEKTIDVSFVGQCYGNRPETIHRLRAEGIRVEAFGYGWPMVPCPRRRWSASIRKAGSTSGSGVWRAMKRPTASRAGISRSP